MSKHIRILILEGALTDAELIEHALQKEGLDFESRRVETKETFIHGLTDFIPDVILADYKLPQFDGLSVLRLMWEMPLTVPIIIISDTLDEEKAVECIKAGAEDFVTKDRLIRLGASIKNILKKRKMEAILEESMTFLNRIMTAVPVGIGLVRNEIFIWVTERLNDMLGYTDDGLVGKSARIVYEKEEEFKRVGKVNSEQYKKTGISEIETRLKRKDGMIIDVLIRSTPIDPNDIEEGVIFTVADLSRVKRTERSLRESEERFRLAFENANTGMTLMGLDGRHLKVNRRLCEMIGYGKEELEGMNFQDITHAEDQETGLNSIQRALNGDLESDVFERRFLHKEGHVVWTHVASTLVRDTYGTPLYFIAQVEDITAQKQAAQERAKLEAELRQANKMEAIGTLAGGIAHDFNNILAAIIGYVELGMLEMPNGIQAKDNLREALKAGFRARDLVKQILAFSRQTELQRIPVQITPIVKEVLKLIRAALPRTIDIHQDIKITNETIEADPTQIHQVLMNLCTNAAHAMRNGGGTLEVVLTKEDLQNVFTDQYPELNPGPYIKLTVRDTGCGIRPEVMDKIFDPYFTTKEKGEGTGMGLSVVHGIVKNHGGIVTVESEPDKGTIFNAYLPALSPIRGTDIKEEDIALPMGNERVLLVEDEKALADVGKQMLERLGYKVETRTSSIEALELFKSKPDQFDIVITDMTMPNMTGEDLAKEIMKIRPEIPIILCTGYSQRMTKQKAEEMGIKEFIMKPLVLNELAKKMRRMVDA